MAPLVHLLRTGDADAQLHAIAVLKILCEPSSCSFFLEALESPHGKVREAAAWGLWRLRDQKAVESLISHLQDVDINVAVGAAHALGWIGDRRAVEPLLLMLENRHWRLRQAAASALAWIGDVQVLDAIRRHLFDPKPQVRKAVKRGLAMFHSRKGQPGH